MRGWGYVHVHWCESARFHAKDDCFSLQDFMPKIVLVSYIRVDLQCSPS